MGADSDPALPTPKHAPCGGTSRHQEVWTKFEGRSLKAALSPAAGQNGSVAVFIQGADTAAGVG